MLLLPPEASIYDTAAVHGAAAVCRSAATATTSRCSSAGRPDCTATTKVNESLYSFEINMHFFPLLFALHASVVIKNQTYVFASKFKIDEDEFVSPHLERGGPLSHHKRPVTLDQER